MARLTLLWTDRAKAHLRDVLDYIAFDNRGAAKALAQRIIEGTRRLKDFPQMGRVLPEFETLPFRELILPPCRVIYLVRGTRILVVAVIRSERQLRPEYLEH